jgi:hypothetical protein
MIPKVKKLISWNDSEGQKFHLVKSHRDVSESEKFTEKIPKVKKSISWNPTEMIPKVNNQQR